LRATASVLAKEAESEEARSAVSAALSEALDYVDQAAQARDPRSIYRALQKSQKLINDLTGTPALDFQSHHIDRVAENPSTFEKDRKARIRSKLWKKAKGLPAAERDKILAASEETKSEIMTLWVDQEFEVDVEEKKDTPLKEIGIIFVRRDAHLKGIHGAERREKSRKDVYVPENQE
jgi:hypothetical protein